MRRSGLVFRFLVLLTAFVFAGGTLIGDVSWAQSQPLVLRGGADRLAPTRDFSFLASNYTEILFSTRGGSEVMVTNRRGMVAMPDFSSDHFELQMVPWVGRPRSQQDGFFVNERADIIAKRLLDSTGQVAGAFLMGHNESELLVDLNRDGMVELSILNSADGFMRASFSGEEGRAAFERILNGENPFCVSSPRSSTMPERARGDASACSPGASSSGGPTGSGSAGGPPPDPMDIICAGYDPVRQRFSGISHGVDPDDPFPMTRETVEFLRDGFDGERDRGAAAARFVLLGWVVGIVAVAEVAQHEATGGLLLYVHAQNHDHDEGEATEGEDADAGEGEPSTPPDTTGGDTSRPGDGGGEIGGPIAAACGSRAAPSQSEAFQSAFQQALNECPNPVEGTAAAGEATASCMSGSISRPRGPRGFMAITEQMLNEATAGCGGEERCAGDRTGRLRQLRSLSSTYLGSRAVCDPAVCQPPLE